MNETTKRYAAAARAKFQRMIDNPAPGIEAAFKASTLGAMGRPSTWPDGTALRTAQVYSTFKRAHLAAHPRELTPRQVRIKALAKRLRERKVQHQALRKTTRSTLPGIASAPAPKDETKGVCTEMRALCSACGGTGDVHRTDGEWLGDCTCIHAWRQRAEKAEARVMELGAQLARRGAPLSPETRQAIAAARAAGQSIAATPGGLVFMNDGPERGCSTLDCPACGGSGHAADAAAGSTP